MTVVAERREKEKTLVRISTITQKTICLKEKFIKNKKLSFLAFVMALCLSFGTIPAYASNPFGSITITLVSEEDIDLSGIEISVYQATPATVTDTSTLYNETFDSPVTTNANGSVTFAKPSQYFSITVELDSLPAGVGVVKQTKFFNPDVTSETITVATVANAEVTLNGTEVSPTFYSADDVPLNAEYEVVAADNNYADMAWESLDTLTIFSVSGTLVNGSMAIPYSVPVDISEANVVEKYKTLYDYGMISEKEMILRQCEVLMEPGNAYMRSAETMDAIEKYRDKLEAQSTTPIDSNEIVAYAAPTTNAELALVEDALAFGVTTLATEQSTNEIARGAHAIVYSDLTGAAIEAFAADIINEMNKIYAYFNEYAGFAMPDDSTGIEGKIAIEIVDNSDEYSPGCSMEWVLGVTYPNGRIWINYDIRCRHS